MQLTAGQRYNNFYHDAFPSSVRGARSRPPQLISASLDLVIRDYLVPGISEPDHGRHPVAATEVKLET
jgi:hypothetical protein